MKKLCKECHLVEVKAQSNFCSQECCDAYLGKLLAEGIVLGINVARPKEMIKENQ